MADDPSHFKRGAFGRGLSVSLAGLRAGGAFALDGALHKLRGGEGERLDSPFARREARRFVAELGRLKGTYVKIGQMLALLGEHFLPPALAEALHELGSGTEPLPWAEVEPSLKAALSARMGELDIEHRAMAAASLAQVHRATVRASGEQIVLKVQYPGLAAVIDADFDAVVRMLLLARWVQAGRDLDDWLDSMREQLHSEIDYQREATMIAEMGRLVAQANGERANAEHRAPLYRVPALYNRYCGDTVLAMARVSGHLVTRAEVARLGQARRNALGEAMLDLFFYELYDWGLLQTDPNIGNYLLSLSSGADELVLLDFGSVLVPEDDFLLHLGNTIAAGIAGDEDALATSLEGLGCLRPDSSPEARRSFTEFCRQLLEPLAPPEALPPEYLNDRGEYRWGQSQLMRRVGRQAAASASTRHFTPPTREFALIARKLTGVFTFIAMLGAEFNAHDRVCWHIERWLERD